jgi:uncharacterized protein Yka (UPF0111/DUF47 family)
MSDVITIRVPRKTKEKLKKYNVNVSETERLGDKIDTQLLTKLIREDRETH